MQIEKRRLKKPSLFDFLHESAGGGHVGTHLYA